MLLYIYMPSVIDDHLLEFCHQVQSNCGIRIAMVKKPTKYILSDPYNKVLSCNIYFLCVIRHLLVLPVRRTGVPNQCSQTKWNFSNVKIAFNKPLIVEPYSHYGEMSCNESLLQ